MRVVGSFSALAAVLLLAAKPSFDDVAKKFPLASLPIDLTTAPHPDPVAPNVVAPRGFDPADAGRGSSPVKLSAADVKALGLENDDLLAAWKKEKKSLFAHARIQRTGHQLLLVRLELPPKQETYLFSFGERGVYLGGIVLHAQSTAPGVVATGASTITAAGAIARVVKVVREQNEAPLPGEFIVTSEQRGKVTSKGSFELMPPFWTSRTGSYRAGDDELRVFDKRVFRKRKGADTFVEMIGDGTNMRMPDELKTWRLIWNERRSEISALSPDGDQVMFTRAW
jgi:hypothetical protein